jgi:hypothetical protein
LPALLERVRKFFLGAKYKQTLQELHSAFQKAAITTATELLNTNSTSITLTHRFAKFDN